MTSNSVRVVPRRTSRAPDERASVRSVSPTASFLMGGADFDSLATRGYMRLIDSPDVAAAVGRVADTISDATIHLMENTEGGDIRIKNALAKFVDITPYSLGTRKTWVSWIVTTMLTAGDGNAFCLPVTRNGLLEDLIPMPGAVLGSLDSGLSYYVSWRGQHFAPDEILHFRFRPDTTEPWRGVGIRVQLRDVLKNLRQAAATTNGFMSSKWKPSVIVKVDALADEFAGPAGRQKLLDDYVAGQRAGEPWVIPSELIDVVQVKPLSLSDLAISDSVTMDKRAVAAVIGVPPYFVGVGAYNQDEYNNYVRTLASSIVTGIQLELTKKLLISTNMYFKFNPWKLYAYGLKDLAQVGSDLYVRGIMDGNEVRDWIGKSPREGLDELVILENYIPRGMIADQEKLNGGGGNA